MCDESLNANKCTGLINSVYINVVESDVMSKITEMSDIFKI